MTFTRFTVIITSDIKLTLELPPLPYFAPEGYYYEAIEFKKNIMSIWLCNTYKFDYNLGAPTKTIHSFYNFKKKVYYAPVNSKTPGKEVNIENTTSYTSMPLKKTSLEMCFV